MPHISAPSATRAELLESARQRWDALLAGRPDLAPAVDLQRRLLTLVIGQAEAIGRGRLPRLSLPPRYVAAKLGRGVPAFSGEPIPIPVPLLAPTLVALCLELAEGGAGEAADHIREKIESGDIDAGSLLVASLSRDQQAIRAGAVHRGLAPDLVWLIAELAVSPFAHALQRTLFAPSAAADHPIALALAAWGHGYCPACGSWPALAEVAGGHRVLRCSFCANAWELPTYACVYCGEDGEGFVTAAPERPGEEDRKDRRVEVCSSCGGYLKAIDVAALSPFPLLAIADMESMSLDVAAMERGYGRPALKEFTKKG